jgi:hypothetical protein
MLNAHARVTIRRPLGEVQAQFADVAYHERNGHHRSVTFSVTSESEQSCSYTQETRLGPMRLRQEFELDRSVPSHQVNALVAGAFSPGAITFDIEADGPDAAIVTATLSSKRSGLTALAAPLLKRPLTRALAKALDEDRDDLESGRYAARPPTPLGS